MRENSSPAGWQNRLLVLLTLVLILAAYVPVFNISLPGDITIGLPMAMRLAMPWAMLFLLPIAIQCGDVRTVQLVFIFLAAYVLPKMLPMDLPFLVGKSSSVLLYLYLALLIAPLRRSMDWLRIGKWNRTATILAIAVILLSVAGLIGWLHFAKPEMSGYAKTLPHVSPRLMPVYMGGFAVVNALLEEIVWRGVVMTALDAAFGAGVFSVVVQAAIFGMAHFHGGFPAGWSGASLAALFGLAMGLLRRYSKGLLVPWVAHSAADFVVIWLIVRFAHG